MRTKSLYAILMTFGLVAVAAGAAMAQGQSGDHAPDAAEREARLAALHAARNESLRSFQENRTDALADYHAAWNATKASFLENKTRVLDACQAQRNASAEDNNSAYAKCVSDGIKPLIESARAAHKAQREALQERLLDAREAAKASFAAARAAHGPRSG